MKKILYSLLTLLMFSLNSIYALEETMQKANETIQTAQQLNDAIKELKKLVSDTIKSSINAKHITIGAKKGETINAIERIQSFLNAILEKLNESENHSQKIGTLSQQIHKDIQETHQATKAAQTEEGGLVDYGAFSPF